MSLLKEVLAGRIQKEKSVPTWEVAVRTAAEPLVSDGSINYAYVDAMVANIHRLGSYMVLMPGMAMPHSRPEDGCTKAGLSLLVLEKPVEFPDNQQVWFILALGAQSSDMHMSVIESIADFLGDDDAFQAIKNASSVEEIEKLIV